MLDLESAIQHCEKVAKQNEEDAVVYSNCKNHKQNLYEIGLAENAEKKCCKCAEEHRQLAEWLKELKQLREQTRWIPWDSGKLPKESGYYTVTAYDGTTKRVTHAKYQKRLKRWELTGARAYWRVLAWLPPLEPWKGEQDG